MLNSSQFQLFSVQAAIWLPNPSAFSQGRFLGTILSEYADRYDGDPQTFPLPNDVPAELPRIVLQSNDGRWKLQAGPSRIDSFWFRKSDENGNDSALKDCIAALATYLRAMKVSVPRIGIVLGQIATVENPPQTLIEHFCIPEVRERIFRGSGAFEIHNHKRYYFEPAKTDINSWVRCRTAVNTATDEPVVSVDQDINIPEGQDQVTFNAERLTQFSRHITSEARSILDQYFP